MSWRLCRSLRYRTPQLCRSGNRTNEVDIEILSVQAADQKVNFVQHEMVYIENTTIPSPLSLQTPDVGFNPSLDYNEYRFDWLPNATDFFTNGKYILSLSTNQPSKEGIVIWNHWSKGLQGWDQGPPTNDSFLLVQSFRLFFNSTNPSGYNRRCAKALSTNTTTATATASASGASTAQSNRSVCTVETITGDITNANSPAAMENVQVAKETLANSENVSHIAFISIGIGCGAVVLIAVAILPILYIKNIKKEARISAARERIADDDSSSRLADSASGRWSEMEHTEGEMTSTLRWKFQQPPNFLLPPPKKIALVKDNHSGGESSDAEGTYIGTPVPRGSSLAPSISTYGGSSDDEAWGGSRPLNNSRPALPTISDIRNYRRSFENENGVNVPLVTGERRSEDSEYFPETTVPQAVPPWTIPPRGQSTAVVPPVVDLNPNAGVNRVIPPQRMSSVGVGAAASRRPPPPVAHRELTRMREGSGYESSTTAGTSDADTDDDAAGLMPARVTKMGR
ncbi:hypothetical protein HDU93_000454 [Gonapodya sp. JEL0774]|nr:hypothetical protein HDU93_000454 [Gonapodya sp. JEL0774]